MRNYLYGSCVACGMMHHYYLPGTTSKHDLRVRTGTVRMIYVERKK